MTHDEWLAIVKDLNKLVRKQMKAIDAVMELHKPISSWVYDELVENHHCSCDEWNEYDMGYPCETIQAIEKKLG
jgi:hypothetical protein